MLINIEPLLTKYKAKLTGLNRKRRATSKVTDELAIVGMITVLTNVIKDLEEEIKNK